jgi:hypothetical protein
MPVFTVESPHGRRYRIEAATQEDALHGAAIEDLRTQVSGVGDQARRAPAPAPEAPARVDPVGLIENLPASIVSLSANAGHALADQAAGALGIHPRRQPITDSQQDAIAGAASGATASIASMAANASSPAAAQAEAQSMVNRTAPMLTGPLSGRSRRQISADVQGLEAERRRAGRSSGSEITADAGNPSRYRPSTPEGAAGQRLGGFVPYAVTGVLPALAAYAGSEAAGAIDEAAGGSPEEVDASRTFGSFAGGMGSGFRLRNGARAPAGIDPAAAPMRPRDAVAAAQYVRRQIPGRPAAEAPALLSRGATAAEAMGPRGRTALGALARREGETGPALQGEIDVRRAGRDQRIQSDVGRATGVDPAAAREGVDALIEAGRARVRPMFDEALSSPDPVTSTRLTTILETPVAQRALRQVYEDMANNPDGPQAASVVRVNPDGTHTLEPTAAALDRLYKAVSQLPERDPITHRVLPDTVSAGNRNIETVRQALRSEFGRLNPRWDEAVRSAGEYRPLESAFHDGGDMLFDNNITERQFGQRVGRLSPAEQPAFRAGIANRVFDMVQSGKLRPAALRTPRVRAKLETAVGREATNELLTALRSEEGMANFERRYGTQGGSITSEITQAHAEQDGAPSPAGHVVQAGADVIDRGLHRAAMGWALGAAKDAGARMRTRGLSPAARDEAGRIFMSRLTQDQIRAHAAQMQRLQGRSRPQVSYEMPRLLALPPAPEQRPQP